MLGPATGLVVTLINIFLLLLIVRAVLSWVPGMLYSEAGRIIVAATEWYLAPIRRVIPPIGMFDASFIVGIVLLYFLQTIIASGNLVVSLSSVIGSLIILFVIFLIIRVVFSFFHMDPWHPVSQVIMAVTDPFAAPFRRWFPRPRYGQFDWAPIAAIVVLLVVYAAVRYVAGLAIG